MQDQWHAYCCSYDDTDEVDLEQFVLQISTDKEIVEYLFDETEREDES